MHSLNFSYLITYVPYYAKFRTKIMEFINAFCVCVCVCVMCPEHWLRNSHPVMGIMMCLLQRA